MLNYQRVSLHGCSPLGKWIRKQTETARKTLAKTGKKTRRCHHLLGEVPLEGTHLPRWWGHLGLWGRVGMAGNPGKPKNWWQHIEYAWYIWWLKYIETNWYQLVKDCWISIAWEYTPWPWNPPIGSIVFWFGSRVVSLEECWWFQWNQVISQ